MHFSSLLPLRHLRPLHLIVYLVLTGAFLLAVAGFLRVVTTLSEVPSQLDFGAYYVAARILNAHGPLYQPSNIDATSIGIADIQHTAYIYPPFFAATLRPLANLPYRSAETVWFFCNVIFFIVTCLLLIQIFHIPWKWGSILFIMSLLMPAVYDTWLLGQLSVILTLIILLSLFFANNSSPKPYYDIFAGILLGIAAAIKVYPIFLVAIYLVHRRWWVLFGVICSLLICLGIGVLFGGGWDTTVHWFTTVLPATPSMSPFPSNQSLRGVIDRFFTENTFNIPVLNKNNYVAVTLTPMLNSPTISSIITLISTTIIILTTAWVLLRNSSLERPFLLKLDLSIGTTVMLLVTPVVWDLYYVHLLLPLTLFFITYQDRTKLMMIFSVVCLLLVLQRYWRYALLYVHSPWFMISGFLATIMLWVTLLYARSQNNVISASQG